jgi:hypothetical protein
VLRSHSSPVMCSYALAACVTGRQHPAGSAAGLSASWSAARRRRGTAAGWITRSEVPQNDCAVTA